MIKKTLEIIVILIIIIGLTFVGYLGYQAYQNWQDRQKSNELKIIETLEANKGAILTIKTELGNVEKRIVTDTLKEKSVIKEEAPTYESKKAEIIELKKEPEVNKEKIEVAMR